MSLPSIHIDAGKLSFFSSIDEIFVKYKSLFSIELETLEGLANLPFIIFEFLRVIVIFSQMLCEKISYQADKVFVSICNPKIKATRSNKCCLSINANKQPNNKGKINVNRTY